MKSPVIEVDLGDGEIRRLFFGATEIARFEVEIGAGHRSFYTALAVGTPKHDQIKRALRLAMIGGGEDQQKAAELVEHFANPPMPLKNVWIAISMCLEAVWNGYPDAVQKPAPKVSDEEADKVLEIMQANFIRQGHNVDIRGMSMAQVLALHDRVFGDDKPEVPDKEMLMAIKATKKNAPKNG